ncbi:MAG: YciI family protein [Actinomycetota bacterium]
MKWIIMMFGDQATMTEVKSPEWIRDMIRFMTELGEELAGSGELVASEGLADPSQAKTIRVKDGIPVPTDGPFAEAKESLAGYYLVEADEERAIEIGSKIVAAIGEPVEVRQVMDAPPEEYTS